MVDELSWFARQCRSQPIRTLREFAESDFIVPEGKRKDEHFRCATLPWSGLLFDEIDSGRWRRVVYTGCVQGGKTLCAYVIPVLWHLFEHREPVVLGVPEMKTAGDKWRKELLPAILAQPKFARHLPTSGAGSQGGFSGVVTLTNGGEARFMAGTGGDETRSNYTTRVASVTEADRLDVSTTTSREAAPIFQIEARTLSYDIDARFYAECTVTIEQGFVWREIAEGSDSRIVCPCCHCGAFVAPEREDLVGWRKAENAVQAAELGAFRCPECKERFDDQQRRTMNEGGVVLHRGQTIARDGEIVGPPPETYTLGLRTNAWHNLLWSTGQIAAAEWTAAHSGDSESAERKQRQWYWVLPIEPEEQPVTPLTAEDVLGRAIEQAPKGVLPAGTVHVSAGVDVRKTQAHFVVIAWLADGSGRVVDLGVAPVDAERWGVRRGLRLALRRVAERLDAGYGRQENPGERLPPGWVAVDAGWQPDDVRGFVREKRKAGIRRYLPSWGRGQSQNNNTRQYAHPLKETPQKPHIGQQYYITFDEAKRLHGLIVNADAWKMAAREALAAPVDTAGALTLFDAVTEDELKLQRQFARETSAESAKEIVLPDRGVVVVFENQSRRVNHLGDATYNAFVTGHLCGVRIVDAGAPLAAHDAGSDIEPVTGPDGDAYLISER